VATDENLVSVSGHLQDEIDTVDRRLIATTVLDAPSDDENFTVMKVAEDISLEKMFAVVRGPGSPSVTWSVVHDDNRRAKGTEVVAGGTTTTNTTTGDEILIMDNPTITGGSWVWLETTVTGGSPQELTVELYA
jgi:ornithine cyclodeaminase/alanine dehydrogenase-like protein (mu-crystallin family)